MADMRTSPRSSCLTFSSAIGVSRAAFYPNVRLNAMAGFEDTGLALASLPNTLWAVGASAMLPLFEGGLGQAG